MLRKSLDTGLSLHRGPFTIEGNLESRWAAHIPGTLKDEWRRALGTGHLSVRDSMKGTMREGSFTGDPERCVKQGSGNGHLLPYGSHFWGTWRGSSFLGPSYLEEFL